MIDSMKDDFTEDLRRLWMDKEEKDKLDAEDLLKTIKTKQDKIKAKEDLIENLLYEKSLITQDLCKSVKEIQDSYFGLFRYIVNGDFMWRTWKYFNYKDEVENDEELTEEEKERYRNDFEFVTVRIKRAFELDDDFELLAVSMYNYYAGYYFQYKYTGDKYRHEEIEIYIPDFTRGDIQDIGGYHINYKSSECCWDYIANGLDYHELAKTLKKWLENGNE